MKIEDQGTVVLFTPDNDEEQFWLDENVVYDEWQLVQPDVGRAGLAVDHRFALDLFHAVREQGFV